MENQEKQNNNQALEPEVKKDGLVDLGDRRQINWERIKISFFLSPYKKARTFLVKENYFTEKEANSGTVGKSIGGWELEKREWEKQALEMTMHNLRKTKAVEMKNFLEEESTVVNQLLNMAKIAMNHLITKKKIKGKDILELSNTKGFKQVTESTLNILKYSRDRLGIAFDKEDEGMKNAINFNFDLVNFEDFNPEQVIDLFKNKDAKQRITKPIKADSISPISKPEKSQG